MATVHSLATGSKTTVYNIATCGDPNAGSNPPSATALDQTEEGEVSDGTEKVVVKEMQYLVKWKNWAHIHNTWESEANLREQKVNGIKKLENFKKKNEEIAEWYKAYYCCGNHCGNIFDLSKTFHNLD